MTSAEEIDIRNKINLAKNILLAIDLEQTSILPKQMLLKKIGAYTSLTDTDSHQTSGYRHKKYTEYIKEMDVVDPEKHPVTTYKFIRDTMVDCYINKLSIPTVSDIVNRMGEGSNESDVLCHLNLLGFTLKALSDNLTMIAEKPEFVLRRFSYLRDMKRHREDGKVLVYLLNLHENILLVVSPQYGVIDVLLHVINTTVGTQKKHVEEWITNTVLPLLPKPCVLIMEDDPCYQRPEPLFMSSKSSMVACLENNNITHDPDCHRAVLYSLIKKYKCQMNADVADFDKVLSIYGVEVVRRPAELRFLCFYQPILMQILEDKNPCTAYLCEWLKENPQELENLDDLLALKEETVYQEDLKLELVVDSLMISNNRRFSETDIFGRNFLRNIL